MYIYIYSYIYTYIYIYICIHIHIHTYIYTPIYTYAYMYIYTYMLYTYIHKGVAAGRQGMPAVDLLNHPCLQQVCSGTAVPTSPAGPYRALMGSAPNGHGRAAPGAAAIWGQCGQAVNTIYIYIHITPTHTHTPHCVHIMLLNFLTLWECTRLSYLASQSPISQNKRPKANTTESDV